MLARLSLVLLMSLIALPVASQDTNSLPASPASAPDTTEVYALVEEEPTLIGGIEGLQQRVLYPEAARRAGIEGTVFVQFVVDETGAVTNARCPTASNSDPLLCEAAIAAVEGSQFTPGSIKGEPVKVLFTVPVRFKLNDPNRCI
ncbi:MAG: TonB family protein [Bacteroidota bacterium]